jgi:antitoxin (DNA-binding transcriptional repressor) of toxin-antitoxin stability system
MTIVNISAAKTHLSRLINRAGSGGKVVVAQARMVAADPT